MMKSIKQQLSLTILVIVLITVALISLLANFFINKQFTNYISKQQELKTQIITTSISKQYSNSTGQWNMDYIYVIGMNSLYEGYIIKVYDQENHVMWDAQAHDMELCNQIIHDISTRMEIKYPQISGEFKAVNYPLTLKGEKIGSVSISYFGPFFLNENEFEFLYSLNTILFTVGGIALILSLGVGHILAKRMSNPILKTVDITKQIAAGNYQVRLEEKTNTKELNMLVDSINHLALSLETLEKLRKQLTGDVAHELRTPITILSSYIEAMTEGVWEPSPERLQSCYDEVMRMGKLVGDLEKLTKIESENLKLVKKRINLYELIKKMVANFEVELDNKNLKVNIDGPDIDLVADQDRLGQVIRNLLSNAIKYSKADSEIYIGLFDNEYRAGFYVEDKGSGIPEEELPYIFERFYRADKSRNRATGGAGIGLAIVKSIVTAHDGRVTVESAIDVGSKFTVILPKGSS